MSAKKAVDSFARLPRVFQMLRSHPDGLPLDTIAGELGTTEKKLRDEILAFYAADMMGFRPEVIQFRSPDGTEAEPQEAAVVRVVTDQPAKELGVQQLPADQWLQVYSAVSALAEVEPENIDLREAADIIATRILAGVPSAGSATDIGRLMSDAVRDHVAVEIVYARSWHPGVTQRVIHPMRLFHGTRGWEVDAIDADNGEVRTFLLDRIRSAEPTQTRFERPADIGERIDRQRREHRVVLNIPQGNRWVVDRFSETASVLQEDEDDLTIAAYLLPPVATRVGLILTIAGADAFVLKPKSLDDAGRDLAQSLLDHHGFN